jgi:hypothetical protein
LRASGFSMIKKTPIPAVLNFLFMNVFSYLIT